MLPQPGLTSSKLLRGEDCSKKNRRPHFPSAHAAKADGPSCTKYITRAQPAPIRKASLGKCWRSPVLLPKKRTIKLIHQHKPRAQACAAMKVIRSARSLSFLM